MANNKDFKVKNGIQPTAYHEGLGTVTSNTEYYNIANASYDSVNKSLSSQNNSPMGLYFTDDGTQMFMVGASADEVNQYSLSTAWDLSTLTYVRVLALAETIPSGIFFKDDGYKMYIAGYGGDNVYEHTLTTAWDISTGTITHTLDVSTVDNVPFGLFFKPDGTKMYFSGDENDKLVEYNLSTAWDLSTATFNQYSPAIVTYPRQPFFTPDGLKVFIPNNDTDVVTEYSLSTAWDVSTLSYVREFDVSDQETAPYVAVFKDDGSKMYVTGSSSDRVWQYSTTLSTEVMDLSTGSVFEITPTSDFQIKLSNPAASGTVSQATLLLTGNADTYNLVNASYDSKSFSVSSQETAPAGLFFKSDGTKMYILGYSSDAVYQYSLSTAWDVSTASYDSVTFALTPTVTVPRCLVFKPDGTKFYLTDNLDDKIYQYGLTTAWDLSTASYDNKNFSYSSQTVQGRGIAFKPDGTKVYLIDDTSEIVYQYSLSTAWDISTASYDSVTLDVTTEDTTPQDIAFNSDGTKLFVVGQQNDLVYQYSLSTAYDVSTGSYDSVSFSISSQETDPSAITFDTTGGKFYVLGTNNDTVYQYSSQTDYTITYDSTLQWGGGTAPDSPAIGETDVLTFSTRDGGTTYQAAIAIDGAA